MLQDPKYNFTDQGIFNRASGEMIPADEPVFLFRASDPLAIDVLHHYQDQVKARAWFQGSNEEHIRAIDNRITAFASFKLHHAERMKDRSDTTMDDQWSLPFEDKAA